MGILILHLQAPLMSFGGPQVDHIGPTGRFATLSQITGLLANALGYRHGEWAKTQALQDRIQLASILVREGKELMDYQTVDLGQEHLCHPGWTTRGHTEYRDGGSASKKTHIRSRHYRADASVLAAVTLNRSGETPTLADLRTALERPARPLFLGRKSCLPATPILVGLIETTEDLADALTRVPATFPERWNEIIARGKTRNKKTKFEIELPVTDERALPAINQRDGVSARVIDQRDWRNRLHGGERVVLRRQLTLRDAGERMP